MDGNQSFDVGENAKELGFAYLFFRYVWPVILFALIVGALFYFAPIFLSYIQYHPVLFTPPNLPQTPSIA